MWNPRFDDIGPVTGSVAGALLCAVLAQCLGSRQSELCAETFSWLLLPTLFRLLGRRSDVSALSPSPPSSFSRPKGSSVWSQWIVAVGISVFSLCKAEMDTVTLLPALTPLLLAVQERLRSDSRNRGKSWFYAPLVYTAWGAALAASFVIFTLADRDPFGLILSAIPTVALFLVYSTCLPKTSTEHSRLPHLDVEKTIGQLSSRVVVALVVAWGLQAVIFGFTFGQLIPTLALSLVKAFGWYFMTQTARHASWPIVALVATFGIVSTRDPFSQTAESQAVLHVLATVITLGQVLHMLPKQARARSILWAFALVSLGPYLANVVALQALSSWASSFGDSRQHPVELLVQGAKDDFAGLLYGQSRTYMAARDEYRRRYHTEPPAGFEGWYDYATSHRSRIIDEFDMIHDAVSPFMALSGKDVLGIMEKAQSMPQSDLWLCSFDGKTAKTQCRHSRRKSDRHIRLLLDKILGGLRGKIPNVKFLVNHIDEPRVLIPPASDGGNKDVRDHGQFNLTNMAHRPVWDVVTKHCVSRPMARNAHMKHPIDTFGLPFVADQSLNMDLCRHPEYSSMHGVVMSPTSFRLFEGLIPILSTGSLSTMGDILMPSPAYIESGFQYDEESDVDWTRKRNNLYWAGSTTGGFALDAQWRNYHRQRFVNLAQHLEPRQHHYLHDHGGVVERVESSFLNSRLFDVVFTRIFQCENKHCRDQKAHFRVKGWADKDLALNSKLVFDIDGNGISGRYYKLLASKSVPLKQTLFREWHDERLVPWVHYVPVSQSMEELPELVLYLTSTEAGQRRAKEIADQGRDWFLKALREVDMSIYTYRLLLELARLQDPDRPAL